MSTKVMVFGTFDFLHPGHLNFFRQARKYGNQLFIIVATDYNVEKIKGKTPVHSEEERISKVKIAAPNAVILLGKKKNMFSIIKKVNPNVICLGYDQRMTEEFLLSKLNLIKVKSKIIRLKPYKENLYKSSKMKEKIKH